MNGCVVSGDVTIFSKQPLDALAAAVEAACGEGEAWSISGGLVVFDADDVVDLLPLQDLTGIDGKLSSGYSLLIPNNEELVSIAALGNLRGALQGGMIVQLNPKLATLDGLEGLEGLGGLEGPRGGRRRLKRSASVVDARLG